MRFLATPQQVTIALNGQEFTCPLAEFLILEPGYSLPVGATEWFTADVHCYLTAAGDQLPADSAAGFYLTKIDQYQTDHAQLFPPEPPPEPEPVSDPRGFKVALMGDDLFLLWQESLPAIAREDMKLAAMADNWPVAQLIYDQLKGAIAPPQPGPVRWQATADAHAIPLTF